MCNSADSLRRALALAEDEQSRITLLINLSDMGATPAEGETPYGLTLYESALRANDPGALVAALSSVVLHYIHLPEEQEVLHRHLDQAEEMLQGTIYDGVVTYYRMTIRLRELQLAPHSEKAGVCDRLLALYDARRETETPSERAERLFVSGIAAYQLLAVSNTKAVTAGIPYWEEEWQLLKSFDPMVRRPFAGNLIGIMMQAYYVAENADKFLEVSSEYLAMLDVSFAEEELRTRRPYLPKDSYYQVCYQSLIGGGRLIGRERAHNYYLKYRDFVNSYDGSDDYFRNNIFYYAVSCDHYSNRGEYKIALAYCDSLIRFRTSDTNADRGSFVDDYRMRAGLLRKVGRSEDACAVYEYLIGLTDSLSQQQFIDKVGEMEAKLGMEKLQIGMLAERRKTQLLLLFLFAAMAVAVGVYLWYSLHRERRLKRELQRQSRIAEESNRVKTEFLNMMSHEVRTPLNVINGFAEVLVSEPLPASQQQEYLVLMQEHARLLTSLMNDMLEVANLDSNSDELPSEPVQINDMLRTVSEYGFTLTKGRSIDLRLELPDEPIVVKTNRGYLTHVFRELLENAIKFSRGNSVTLSCRVDQSAGLLLCSVTDTGVGIPVDKSEAIFERFVQLDPFAQGTGLGLSLCRLIMQKLGGAIYVDLSYTEGARLVVALPLTEKRVES